MADDLELLVGSVEGEGPSPEFVARLRERIVQEETEGPADTVGGSPIVEVELLPSPSKRPPAGRWVVLAAAAAVVLLVGAVALFTGDDESGVEQLDTASDPTVTFDADAVVVTEEYSLLDEGSYRVDTVGTPITFRIDDPQAVQINSRASFVLTHPASHGSADRDLVITRLTALADPSQPTVASEDPGDGWPATDFAGWLDNIGDELVLSNREAVTLGVLDAIRVDLELGETGCVVGGGPCFALGSNGSISEVELVQGAMYRVWVVDQGDEDPVVVMAGIGRESDIAWFETVETILSTLVFGDIGPNPIVDPPAGETELSLLGGVRFRLGEGSFVLGDPTSYDKVILEDWPGHSGFLTNPLDAEGNTLPSPTAVVTALRSSDASVTAIESMVVDGVETQVFDISGSSPERVVLVAPGARGGWQVPVRGRMWLIDHPDRGVLMVTAEASENIDVVFPLVVAETEAIIESLEFIRVG